MPAKKNFYDLLRIPKDASLEEIRRAYHDAARKLHPDVNVVAGDTELFVQVQEAYEVLSHPKNREAYDEELAFDSLEPVVTGIQYSRPSLTFLQDPQLIHVLLDFSANKKFASLSSPPINVCLVLDRSTSMQGTRMDTVKTAALELVRQMKPADLLSIVAFSDRAEVIIPAGRPSDQHMVDTRISMLRAGGGTEIFQGLETGFSEIYRNSSRTTINHIILLTDGRTYGDEAACLKLADKAATQGVQITGIGIGAEWNDVFMDELGSRTGGSSFFISRVSDLRSFLQEKLNSLYQTFAERVILDLKTEAGVALSSAFRLQPDSAILSSTPPLRLGSILKTSTLSILLEFIVQPFSTDINRLSFARGELNLVLPSDPTIPHKIPINLSRITSQSISTEPPPRKIFRALSQITLYRMQERARREVADGKVQEASLRLQRLAKHLFSSGEQELANTATMEAERIQQTNMFSAEGEKRIKYGTRSFALPSVAKNGGET